MPLNSLGSLFGKSPFEPIQEHMKQAQACAAALKPFIDAVLADDWERAEKAQQIIVDLENEADKLKKQVRLQLPNNLFLPVPRADLSDPGRMQVAHAHRRKDMGGLKLRREMQVPGAAAAALGG